MDWLMVAALFVLGGVVGIVLGWWRASGKAALALAFMPIGGYAVAGAFC